MSSSTHDPLARKRPLPILSEVNYEEWFDLGNIYFQAKGLEFVITQEFEVYTATAKFQSLALDTPTSESSASSGHINIDKKEKWVKADAEVMYIITICVEGIDKMAVRKMETAKDMWDYLKSQYFDDRDSIGQVYLENLVTYKMKEGATIEGAWIEIQRLRDRVVGSDKSFQESFRENRLFQILLRALPLAYNVIRDTMETFQGTTRTKLKILKDKEDRIKEETVVEATALAVTYGKKDSKSNTDERQQKSKKPRRQSSDESIRDARKARRHERKQIPSCYICGEDHLILDCDFLEGAQQYARKIRKLKQKKSKKDSKGKGYTAESDSESNDESEDDSESEAEVAAISKSQISEIPPSDWVADTGASSHMTDQLHLFRGPLIKIKRRTIKVGGGKLYADRMGTVEMRVRDGERGIKLKKTLLVPKLGVNLLSGPKLCEAGLKGSWDEKRVYLHNQHGREVLGASRRGGVYIIDRIADEANEVAFHAKDPHVETNDVVADPTRLRKFQKHAREQAYPMLIEESQSDKEDITDAQLARYKLWHRRFAHFGPEKLRNLHKSVVIDKPIYIPSKRCICEVCQLAKMRNRMSKKLSPWKEELLGLVSIDIAGPFPKSLRGNIYFLEIIENSTRKVWTIPLKTKDASIQELTRWKATVELETGMKLKSIRSDNGTELKKILDNWSEVYGIETQYTTTYSSHQNGAAERAIQTTENSVRAMLKDTQLPLEFWDEAAETDAYLRNRTASGPTWEDRVLTPEEAYSGTKPSVNHLRVWGSKCYSYVNPKSLPAGTRHDKFVDRGRIAVFMGYVETTDKQYRVYAPDLGYVTIASVVTVDETAPGGTIDLKLRTTTLISTTEQQGQGTKNELPVRRPRGRPGRSQVVEAIKEPDLDADHIPETRDQVQRTEPVQISEPIKLIEKASTPADSNLTPLVESIQIPVKRGRGRPRKAPTSIIEPPQIIGKRPYEDDGEEGRTEMQRRKISAFIARLMQSHDIEDDGDNEYAWNMDETKPNALRVNIPIPKTYKQAIADPVYGGEWRLAVQREIDALVANRTWTEEVAPKNANLVSTKWVFTVKFTPDGELDRFKARLVARGFTQEYGSDYTETFAPTVRMDTLRLILAIVAKEDLECHQVDVDNAFTESKLEEEIYLAPPEGIVVPPGMVLQARQSLYGLKQSGRNWNKRCTLELVKIGFRQSKADPCLFVHPSMEIILFMHVDDLVFAAKTKFAIEWFKSELRKSFKTKDLGETKMILGIKIVRNRKERTITMDQSHYLMEVLRKAGIDAPKHRPISTPMNGYESLRPAGPDDQRTDRRQYQQTIGSLMYAMVYTRPDIAFALGKLCQYLSDPAEYHAQALKHLLRYIRSTVDLKICFGRKNEKLILYSDADWAADKIDRKSTTGSVCMFYGGPISWASKKQRSVATSSTESEYIALSTSGKQSQWLAQILRDIDHGEYLGANPYEVEIREDNQGALALAKNPHLHERSKHIDICYHYIRDLVDRTRAKLVFIPTEDMVADGFTKPLSGSTFTKFIGQLGMQENV